MKPATLLSLFTTALTSVGVTPQPCKFSLVSSEPFNSSLWQFGDGQMRLNGSYAPATFSIAQDGGIRDSRGFGCFVTELPSAQVRCGQARKPARGFAIDQAGRLSYRGGTSFFACPGLYGEYSLSVGSFLDPEGCLPVTLRASDCGSPCPPPPAPETVWATRKSTVTITAVHTLTEEVLAGTSRCGGGNYSFTPGVMRRAGRPVLVG